VSDEPDSPQPDEPAAEDPADSNQSEPLPSEEEDEFADPAYKAARTVVERNGIIGNTIVVEGDVISSAEGGGQGRSALLFTDITKHVDAIGFVEAPSYASVANAVADQPFALLAGSGCGNWVTASVALRRTGHEPILELPGSLPAPELSDLLKRACKKPKTGVVVDSVDPQTLGSLRGFRLRHLRSALPDGAAVVFTARDLQSDALGDEIPVIEGAPPKGEDMLRSLAETMELPEEALTRAREALKLLPEKISPGMVSDLVNRSAEQQSPEALAAIVAGKSPVLDEWLAQQPDARALAAVATAAAADGLPSSEFDRAAAALRSLLERNSSPPEEPIRFASRGQGLPIGLATCKPSYVATYFGWQPTEVVEICLPHQSDAVLRYLWRHLDGDFRQPFLQWLRDLPDSFGGRLGFAAARTAGILFSVDPVTIERSLLKPWAMDDRSSIRNCTAFALGMPATLGEDVSSARRLLSHWSNLNSTRLKEAAVAAYGGPLGIWNPSTAAPSRLWEAGWKHPEFAELSNRCLASLFTGGREAERAREATTSLLVARAESQEAARVFDVLPFVFVQLTGGGRMARESLEALSSEAEEETRKHLTRLLSHAFDNREGREAAQATLAIFCRAVAAGRINQEVVELLIREMKADAKERGRISELKGQLNQALKAIERKGGAAGEVARSIHDTFYKKDQGGNTLESK